MSAISEAATGAWMTYRTPCASCTSGLWSEPVGHLAEQSDLPEGQGGQRGRDEEGAGATSDMEQRRGQQRPQQPCAIHVRLEKGDGVEQVALRDETGEHRLLHRRARRAGCAMDEGERDEWPSLLASRPGEQGEPEVREQADRVQREQHRPPVETVGEDTGEGGDDDRW